MAALERFPDAGLRPQQLLRLETGARRATPRRPAQLVPAAVRVGRDVRPSALVSASRPMRGPTAGPTEVDAYAGDLYYWSIFSPMVLPSTAIIRRGALAPGEQFPERDSVGDWEFFARLSHRRGAVFLPRGDDAEPQPRRRGAAHAHRSGRPAAAAHRPDPACVAAGRGVRAGACRRPRSRRDRLPASAGPAEHRRRPRRGGARVAPCHARDRRPDPAEGRHPVGRCPRCRR